MPLTAAKHHLKRIACWGSRGGHLDVVRLLGERQDIEAILGNEFASN